MKNTQPLLSLILLCFALSHAAAAVILPKLISDGMVLQRESVLNIWGWADAGERVTVSFQGQDYKTTASPDGHWSVKLPKMKAGGPYQMRISGKNILELKGILIGEVWLCAGQSNMVHQLDIHDVTYADEIARANYPEIRHFKIPTTTSLSGPQADLTAGSWEKAVGEAVRPFSAVAYFFAKKIYGKYGVPIGLINASVGGTPIEAWIPEEGFTPFPDLLGILQENKDTAFVGQLLRQQAARQLPRQSRDEGLNAEKPWYDVDFSPKDWRRINIPGYWEDKGIRDLNGVVWYRREITLPASMSGKAATLFLGRIVDADELYINGTKVGSTSYQYPQRRYDVPAHLLRAGKNSFVIRVSNYAGKGGFVPDKPYCLFTDQDTIDLKGYWHYKVGEVFPPMASTPAPVNGHDPQPRSIHPQNEPAALYNAMIAPFTAYSIKGVLWYQGESNTRYPEIYEAYMQALVKGWRTVFHHPELPFIYAQLPNFMEVNYLPEESNWALLRESQRKALSIPHTAMTVNIDLGEWNDIHPDNKKDVGERMALAALKLAYGEHLVYSDPMYQSHRIEGHRIVLSFAHIGSGLVSKDGEALRTFAIAGADKHFVWAQAEIVGDQVVVWSEAVPKPLYLRYAWADNPNQPNLYNKEGLPAAPFRVE